MSRLLVFTAAASFISLTAETALTQEVPDPPSDFSDVVRIQAQAEDVYDSHDLISNGVAVGDMVWVTSIPSSGMIDPPSYEDR